MEEENKKNMSWSKLNMVEYINLSVLAGTL